MQTPEVGRIIKDGDKAFRDAIHVAIAPVIAGQNLRPGTRVSLNANGEAIYTGIGETSIGIVDPFLEVVVWRGQRFWLFLFPNTVTSLRHVWTHPAFMAKMPDKE